MNYMLKKIEKKDLISFYANKNFIVILFLMHSNLIITLFKYNNNISIYFDKKNYLYVKYYLYEIGLIKEKNE